MLTVGLHQSLSSLQPKRTSILLLHSCIMKVTPTTNVNALQCSMIVQQYTTISLQEINPVTHILPRQEFLLAHSLRDTEKLILSFWIPADTTKRQVWIWNDKDELRRCDNVGNAVGNSEKVCTSWIFTGYSSIKTDIEKKHYLENTILKAFAKNIENNHKKKTSWQEQRIPRTASDKFFAAGHIR